MLFFWQGWFSLPGTAGGRVAWRARDEEQQDDEELLTILGQHIILTIGA